MVLQLHKNQLNGVDCNSVSEMIDLILSTISKSAEWCNSNGGIDDELIEFCVDIIPAPQRAHATSELLDRLDELSSTQVNI